MTLEGSRSREDEQDEWDRQEDRYGEQIHLLKARIAELEKENKALRDESFVARSTIAFLKAKPKENEG